jgi:hypothetical protein
LMRSPFSLMILNRWSQAIPFIEDQCPNQKLRVLGVAMIRRGN